jgi:hypothetical protein
VFAIAPSPAQKGLIWAGTNDGKVWNTRDGGATWNDLTNNIAGMPAGGTVRRIEPSRFDPGTAYLALDLHLMDNRKPYLYKTMRLHVRRLSDSANDTVGRSRDPLDPPAATNK